MSSACFGLDSSRLPFVPLKSHAKMLHKCSRFDQVKVLSLMLYKV